MEACKYARKNEKNENENKIENMKETLNKY